MTSPQHFRKKPVVVQAMRLDHGAASQVAIIDWIRGTGSGAWASSGGSVLIATLEGDMRASVGDYVILGVQGESYPCKPDIFEATYEPAEVTA